MQTDCEIAGFSSFNQQLSNLNWRRGKREQKKEHYYRRRTRIAMPFLIITIITSRAVRSYDHVSRISYSGVSVKGLI